MELERTLFRVHERFLSLEPVKKTVNYCYKASILILIVTLPLFLYGNIKFMGSSPCLKPIVDREYILDPMGIINQTQPTNETQEGLVSPASKPIINLDDLIVIKIADLSKENIDLDNTDNLYLFFEYSATPQVVLMDPTIRANHSFTEHNITIDIGCYSNSFFGNLLMYGLDYENIMINEIIVTFQGYNRFMKNNITTEIWSFTDTQVQALTNPENFIVRIFYRILGILKLLLGIFLVSNITAIYNKMTIICAPIFILAAYSLCAHPSQRQHDRMNIYRAFPWIGMYLYTLNNNGRSKDRYIILAFFCMIVVFYCLYLAALVFWNLLLFNKSFPKGLDENFYGFLALLEFLVLLFLRTRTTIKFFPKMSMIVMVMFLYYVQYTPYGFYNMALFMMSWSILGLFAYFLMHFEIPGLDWNPSYHYTPSIDSPRTLYSPIFSLTWYHDLPQLWTMFFPIFGRSHFTNTELAMVNRNYPLLASTLENAAQGVRPQNDQDGNNELPVNQNNNFAFPMQELGNIPPAQAANVDNGGAVALNINQEPQPNLLQSSEPNLALNISDERSNNNTRLLNWRAHDDNNQYRRIDDEA